MLKTTTLIVATLQRKEITKLDYFSCNAQAVQVLPCEVRQTQELRIPTQN